jgi:hypothetical protein
MSYNNEITEENNEESDEFWMPDGIEYVSMTDLGMTVLNRQTNGPHPDCDLEFDAVGTPQDEEDEDEDDDFELPPTHPLDLGIFNFVDNDPYSIFYNRMYNIIDPRIISYYEESDEDQDENKIRETYMDELVMPMPCSSCCRFECNC